MKLTRTLIGFSVGTIIGTVIVASVHLSALAKDKTGEAPAIHVDNTPINRDPQSGNSYAAIVKKTAPAVVNIYAKRFIKERVHRIPWMNDPLFRQFFGNQFPDDEQELTRREEWLGSGIIVTSDGYILTANHVAQDADEIKVVLANDKKEYDAKVVGKDPDTDVAVLKIDAKNLPAVTLGNSDKLEVGDVVLAIGNPFGVGQSVTKGIISALGRSLFDPSDPNDHGARYQDFIQTDAAINKGNSGGALVDAEGRLIGINDAIASPNGGNVGLGFAVPINMARSVMERLIAGGKIQRGYLGVLPQDLDAGLAQGFNLSDRNGALVADVITNSPASKAGIESGDIILTVNGKKITGAENLSVTISQFAPGSEVELKIFRNGRLKDVSVKLGKLRDVADNSNDEQQSIDSDDSNTDAIDGGVTVQNLNPQIRRRLGAPSNLHGALVVKVDQDSNFADAGLSTYDVIVEINRQPVADAGDATRLYKAAKGDQILLKVWRPTMGGMRYLSVDNTAQK